MKNPVDRPAPRRRPVSTRALLQVAAFAAVQVLIVLLLSPFVRSIAIWSPPAYALVAGLQTVMIFAARRFTGMPWGATFAAVLTAIVCAPFSAIGWLFAVPLVLASALFDGVSAIAGRRRWSVMRDSIVSGLVVGIGLFLVSLPVMSPEHLGPVLLAATLLARVVASWGGALVSAVLVARLERVGVRRRRTRADAPSRVVG